MGILTVLLFWKNRIRNTDGYVPTTGTLSLTMNGDNLVFTQRIVVDLLYSDILINICVQYYKWKVNYYELVVLILEWRIFTCVCKEKER